MSKPLYDPLHPDSPAVACETCGQPTPMTGTKRCDGCWEVEHRLRDYLRAGGAKACAFVVAALGGVAPPTTRGIDSNEYAAETVNPMKSDLERRMWEAHHEKCGSCGHIRSQHECHFVGGKPNPCLRCGCESFIEPSDAKPQ